MRRDFERFPDDANGDVLWHLTQAGDSLTVPRDIEFTLIFDTEQAARHCAALLRKTTLDPALKAQLVPPSRDEEPEGPWTVEILVPMVPNHADITALEQDLAELAELGEGRFDGWTCNVVHAP